MGFKNELSLTIWLDVFVVLKILLWNDIYRKKYKT